MNTNFKILAIIGIVFLTSVSVMAQNVKFEYDTQGRRKLRYAYIVTSLSQAVKEKSWIDTTEGYAKASLPLAVRDSSTKESFTLSPKDDSRSLAIFPNPTSGELQLVLTTTATDKTSAQLYSTAGIVVWSGSIVPGNNQLDLSSQSSGYYFLRVEHGSDVQVWKIEKLP